MTMRYTYTISQSTLAVLVSVTTLIFCTSKHDPSVLYTEQHRPQLHFSPPANWMNDPNGMVFFEGEYHLFYQYYPDSTVWGPMHWGHAVSKDLLHWEHLPIALYPDSSGYIFSGSAVVDWNNSSGLGEAGKPPLVAIYTYHDMAAEKAGRLDYQSQGIAYSNDRGRSWHKYDQNPVLPNPGQVRDFRDPKVFWHEPGKQWIMALAVGEHIEFWASSNLKNWSVLSSFGQTYGSHGGVWECPDLFPLRLSDTGETFWVLLVSINPGGPNGGSATQYFIGQFDGTNFVLDPGFASRVKGEQGVWLDYGRDNYAGVTWSDLPANDGRRLFLGWMGNWDYAQVVPTSAWRSAMTLPRTLELYRSDNGDLHLASLPVAELNKLRVQTTAISAAEVEDEYVLPVTFNGMMELQLELECRDGNTVFGIEISNPKGEYYRIGCSLGKQQYYTDRSGAGEKSFSDKFVLNRHIAPRLSNSKRVQLQLFVDHASAELFADGGLSTMTDIFFPSEPYSIVKVFSEGGKVSLCHGQLHTLKGIWK